MPQRFSAYRLKDVSSNGFFDSQRLTNRCRANVRTFNRALDFDRKFPNVQLRLFVGAAQQQTQHYQSLFALMQPRSIGIFWKSGVAS
jgi:hypothetical protein